MGFDSNAGISQTPIGSMYQNDSNETIIINTINVDEKITGFTSDISRLITPGIDQLEIQFPGLYRIDYSLSFSMIAGANQEIEIGIGKDGSRIDPGVSHRKITTATDTGNTGSSLIVQLEAGEVITLVCRNESSTNNVLIEHCSVNIERIF